MQEAGEASGTFCQNPPRSQAISSIQESEQALGRGTASDQQEPLEREHMLVELNPQQEGWESPQKIGKNGKWKGMDKRNEENWRISN